MDALPVWEAVRARNLLSLKNLDLVREEFRNDGVVFGFHSYYGGGRDGEVFCFADYESYFKELSGSRPGDHFTVYSRHQLADKAFFRLGDAISQQPVPNSDELVEVKHALAAHEEVVFVWRQLLPGGGVDCAAGLLWDPTDEELEAALGLGAGRGGEFLFLILEMLHEDERGIPIPHVSPYNHWRVNAVVDGKRPDERGRTPESGPY